MRKRSRTLLLSGWIWTSEAPELWAASISRSTRVTAEIFSNGWSSCFPIAAVMVFKSRMR